ncbi:MAG: EscU/YscU/HrcU family type III secretion system export apparatus switch protein [Lysobacteraceae bacterium]
MAQESEDARVIREVADRHCLPIVSAPALVRSLWRQVDIGREIPVQLYCAEARGLSHV